jgi:hypothetical protein
MKGHEDHGEKLFFMAFMSFMSFMSFLWWISRQGTRITQSV